MDRMCYNLPLETVILVGGPRVLKVIGRPHLDFYEGEYLMSKPRKVTRKPAATINEEKKRERTWKDYAVIGIYILLALALVIPLVTSVFTY